MLCLLLYNFEQQLLIPSPKKTEDLTHLSYTFMYLIALSVFSIPFETLLFIYVLDPPPPLCFLFFSVTKIIQAYGYKSDNMWSYIS